MALTYAKRPELAVAEEKQPWTRYQIKSRWKSRDGRGDGKPIYCLGFVCVWATPPMTKGNRPPCGISQGAPGTFHGRGASPWPGVPHHCSLTPSRRGQYQHTKVQARSVAGRGLGQSMMSAGAPGMSGPSTFPAAARTAALGLGEYWAEQSVTGLKVEYQVMPLLPVLHPPGGVVSLWQVLPALGLERPERSKYANAL